MHSETVDFMSSVMAICQVVLLNSSKVNIIKQTTRTNYFGLNEKGKSSTVNKCVDKHQSNNLHRLQQQQVIFTKTTLGTPNVPTCQTFRRVCNDN